ncbi:MAG: hypothetical protein ACRC46_04955 [Thermoguttaceae bacterium]
MLLILVTALVAQLGCEIMPTVRVKPTLHNPYPQLTDIAVVPFFNRTGATDIDGRECARLYAEELQRVPGYRVVAQSLVENAMIENEITRFESADDIRKLGRLLGVEAVVVGSVNSFHAYYPQNFGLDVEWYAVNPYFHTIVPGSGLPWGTPEESQIPDRILLQAEHALARAQLQTQTPDAPPQEATENRFSSGAPPSLPQRRGKVVPVPGERLVSNANGIQLVSYWDTEPANAAGGSAGGGAADATLNLTELAAKQQEIGLNRQLIGTGVPYVPGAESLPPAEPVLPQPLVPALPKLSQGPEASPWSDTVPPLPPLAGGVYNGSYPGYPIPPGVPPEALAQYGWMPGMVPPQPMLYPMMPAMPTATPGQIVGEPDRFPGLPADWPDPRGFIPDGPLPERPKGEVVNKGPVIQHSAIYKANDRDFTQALADYDLLFRDDKRIDGWQGMIENQTEFVSFCCRMHIWEMLTARGGAGKGETVTKTWKPWVGGRKTY